MITRFAPSPTGYLHLGHAFSALTIWDVARRMGGTVLLRIEDTDSNRARPTFDAAIQEDLRWLGLAWSGDIRRQSEHLNDYDAALARLEALDLIYPCSCTRRQIVEAGATSGTDGLVYPGTCRHRTMADWQEGDAVRLDLAKALALIGHPISYDEWSPLAYETRRFAAADLINSLGDPVLKRKDSGDIAYLLACAHDDALQSITYVIRGQDLEAITPLQVVLQRVLGYPTPFYYHHALIRDDEGKRLAKVDRSKAIAKYRAEGLTPADIRELVGFGFVT